MGVEGGQRVRRGAGPRREGVVSVGLTGGIGAGKSTALALFAETGAITRSADRIVHDLYESPDLVRQLTQRFGAGIVGAEGEVDRRRLSQVVKGDTEALRWLEGLTHPLVEREVLRTIEEAPTGSVVVCEVPLLFEAGLEGLFDLVVTIEAERHNRFSRSSDRFDPVLFAEFEALQATSERRVAGSDMAFHNDGSVERLRSFVEGVYGRAAAMLAVAGSGGTT